MISFKKIRWKKVFMIVLIVLLIYSSLSMIATKIIYDAIFDRYECVNSTVPPTLQPMVEQGVKSNYLSGENQLTGYLYQSNAADKQDTLIIWVSGHHACSHSYLWQINELLALGWSVFVFDATGCCASQGDSAVGFSQELLDLRATINYVEKCNRFGYNELVLLGHSQGGYAACCALASDFDISAVISVSGVNSAMEGVIGAAREYVGPLAYANYGFLWLYQSILFDVDTLNMRANDVIAKTSVPVLLVHGDNDQQVPVDRYSIFSYKNEIDNPKVEYALQSLEGHDGHTDLLFDDDGTANDRLIAQIHGFLQRNIH